MFMKTAWAKKVYRGLLLLGLMSAGVALIGCADEYAANPRYRGGYYASYSAGYPSTAVTATVTRTAPTAPITGARIMAMARPITAARRWYFQAVVVTPIAIGMAGSIPLAET